MDSSAPRAMDLKQSGLTTNLSPSGMMSYPPGLATNPAQSGTDPSGRNPSGMRNATSPSGPSGTRNATTYPPGLSYPRSGVDLNCPAAAPTGLAYRPSPRYSANPSDMTYLAMDRSVTAMDGISVNGLKRDDRFLWGYEQTIETQMGYEEKIHSQKMKMDDHTLSHTLKTDEQTLKDSHGQEIQTLGGRIAVLAEKITTRNAMIQEQKDQVEEEGELIDKQWEAINEQNKAYPVMLGSQLQMTEKLDSQKKIEYPRKEIVSQIFQQTETISNQIQEIDLHERDDDDLMKIKGLLKTVTAQQKTIDDQEATIAYQSIDLQKELMSEEAENVQKYKMEIEEKDVGIQKLQEEIHTKEATIQKLQATTTEKEDETKFEDMESTNGVSQTKRPNEINPSTLSEPNAGGDKEKLAHSKQETGKNKSVSKSLTTEHPDPEVHPLTWIGILVQTFTAWIMTACDAGIAMVMTIFMTIFGVIPNVNTVVRDVDEGMTDFGAVIAWISSTISAAIAMTTFIQWMGVFMTCISPMIVGMTVRNIMVTVMNYIPAWMSTSIQKVLQNVTTFLQKLDQKLLQFAWVIPSRSGEWKISITETRFSKCFGYSIGFIWSAFCWTISNGLHVSWRLGWIGVYSMMVWRVGLYCGSDIDHTDRVIYEKVEQVVALLNTQHPDNKITLHGDTFENIQFNVEENAANSVNQNVANYGSSNKNAARTAIHNPVNENTVEKPVSQNVGRRKCGGSDPLITQSKNSGGTYLVPQKPIWRTPTVAVVSSDMVFNTSTNEIPGPTVLQELPVDIVHKADDTDSTPTNQASDDPPIVNNRFGDPPSCDLPHMKTGAKNAVNVDNKAVNSAQSGTITSAPRYVDSYSEKDEKVEAKEEVLTPSGREEAARYIESFGIASRTAWSGTAEAEKAFQNAFEKAQIMARNVVEKAREIQFLKEVVQEVDEMDQSHLKRFHEFLSQRLEEKYGSNDARVIYSDGSTDPIIDHGDDRVINSDGLVNRVINSDGLLNEHRSTSELGSHHASTTASGHHYFAPSSFLQMSQKRDGKGSLRGFKNRNTDHANLVQGDAHDRSDQQVVHGSDNTLASSLNSFIDEWTSFLQTKKNKNKKSKEKTDDEKSGAKKQAGELLPPPPYIYDTTQHDYVSNPDFELFMKAMELEGAKSPGMPKMGAPGGGLAEKGRLTTMAMPGGRPIRAPPSNEWTFESTLGFVYNLDMVVMSWCSYGMSVMFVLRMLQGFWQTARGYLVQCGILAAEKPPVNPLAAMLKQAQAQQGQGGQSQHQGQAETGQPVQAGQAPQAQQQQLAQMLENLQNKQGAPGSSVEMLEGGLGMGNGNGGKGHPVGNGQHVQSGGIQVPIGMQMPMMNGQMANGMNGQMPNCINGQMPNCMSGMNMNQQMMMMNMMKNGMMGKSGMPNMMPMPNPIPMMEMKTSYKIPGNPKITLVNGSLNQTFEPNQQMSAQMDALFNKVPVATTPFQSGGAIAQTSTIEKIPPIKLAATTAKSPIPNQSSTPAQSNVASEWMPGKPMTSTAVGTMPGATKPAAENKPSTCIAKRQSPTVAEKPCMSGISSTDYKVEACKMENGDTSDEGEPLLI